MNRHVRKKQAGESSDHRKGAKGVCVLGGEGSRVHMHPVVSVTPSGSSLARLHYPGADLFICL